MTNTRKNDDIFAKRILKQAGRTINQYRMIGSNDTAAIGISGGKDSTALLDILVRRKKHLPINYTIVPVFVRMKWVHDNVDTGQLRRYCMERAGSFHELNASCDMTTEKDPCFVCSWHRRKTLFDFCKEKEISTIAFGHTMDDRAETLLMNLFFQGNFSTMPVSQHFFDGTLRIIRPLAEISEADIFRYTKILGLPVDKKECKFFTNQSRKKVRTILSELEKDHPHVKNSIVSSINNIKPEYL